tara:strand:- start:763 stop:1185 length:423 start_codon:yes stop_codon:yes gene_type:complete
MSLLISSRKRFLTLGRFAIVGLFSAALYAVLMLSATAGLGLRPWVSSAAAYTICIPTNYLLQRYFTFVSKGSISKEIPRYISTHLVNLLLSTIIVYVIVDVMDFPVLIAASLVVIAIPLLQFLVLESWVFRHSKDSHGPL